MLYYEGENIAVILVAYLISVVRGFCGCTTRLQGKGWVYKLVPMEGRVSLLLGCLHASRAVSFCFSFSHVVRYAPLWKTKTSGTIAANPSQANL